MENINLQAAIEYISKTPIFPVSPKKDTPVQGIIGTQDPVQAGKWWKFNLNIGMPTGNASGIFVITFGSKEAYEEAQIKDMPLTPVSTNGKCYYVFFNHKDGIEAQLSEDVIKKMNITYNQRYVLLPPSIVEVPGINSKSETYTWLEGLSLLDVGSFVN